MSIIGKWRKQIAERHTADQATEFKHRIVSTEPKSVSPADIERLEEQMVPWLREKRRRARNSKK